MGFEGTERCADIIVQILHSKGVKHIFGHPGEQILPLYDALRESDIKHVLMRHEQGAAHAADGYARSSGRWSVCIASAGPGALNLVMGVATAYKDSIPLLVITGDVPTTMREKNVFQQIRVCDVFKPITIKSYNITNPEKGINKLKIAINMLENGRTGPIHLNFPKDVLSTYIDPKAVPEPSFNSSTTDLSQIEDIKNIIKEAAQPLIIAGNGVFWSHTYKKVQEIAEKHEIPVATTYPARGIIREDHSLSLGLIGLRGTEAANYAGKNADLILALGCRLSERTCLGIGESTIIHVNTDKKVLKGDINLNIDLNLFFKGLTTMELSEYDVRKKRKEWLRRIDERSSKHHIKSNSSDFPMKPQHAIKEILEASENDILVNDAGAHTTWVNLLKEVNEPATLIFSGAMGPMGYGLPAAIGVALSRPDKRVLVVVGDGGFQMTLQELGTLKQLDLPIVISIINNSSLGIIKQWQNTFYGGEYQVELKNPDFVKLAESYDIKSARIKSPEKVYEMVIKAQEENKPYLLDIIVDPEENIPLPVVK